MKEFHIQMFEFKKQLEKGDIQVAYKGLIDFISGFRIYLDKKYPRFQIPNNLYLGYMDMTYFPIFTDLLKQKKLKIAVVFDYEKFRFEVWLSGSNKKVLTKYWKLLDEEKYDKYKIVKPGPSIDFVLEHVLDDNPDFKNLNMLNEKIETGITDFIDEVEGFLLKNY